MKRWIGLAAFQILTMMGWAAQNEYVRATAATFHIPLPPRDPYDVLRGRYFVLNPRDAAVKTGLDGTVLTTEEVRRFLDGKTSFVGPAWVGFCPQRELYRVCALARPGEPREAAAPVLPARENPQGWEVEVCPRPRLSPLPRRLFFKGQPVFAD